LDKTEDKKMSGKGSKQRPTDKAKFDENFERIFGKAKNEDKKNETVPAPNKDTKSS